MVMALHKDNSKRNHDTTFNVPYNANAMPDACTGKQPDALSPASKSLLDQLEPQCNGAITSPFIRTLLNRDPLGTRDAAGKLLGKDLLVGDGAKFIETVDSHGHNILLVYDCNGRITRKNTYDRNFNLIISEFRDEHGNKVVASRDRFGNETDTRYDCRGRITDIQRRDAKGRISFDEHIYSDGSVSYTHYGPRNQITAIDYINRLGIKTSRCEYDSRGRETRNVRYNNGKSYSETISHYCDATGQMTMTHISEEGFADFVRVVQASGEYKEYGYDRLKRQTYYEEGVERGLWARHYPNNPQFNQAV